MVLGSFFWTYLYSSSSGISMRWGWRVGVCVHVCMCEREREGKGERRGEDGPCTAQMHIYIGLKSWNLSCPLEFPWTPCSASLLLLSLPLISGYWFVLWFWESCKLPTGGTVARWQVRALLSHLLRFQHKVCNFLVLTVWPVLLTF